MSNNQRLEELDGLRGLAALSVILLHLLWSVKGINPRIFIFTDGFAAVDLFFVLSGFVLAYPYFYNDKKMSVFSFYVKRIFRIYPSAIFVIILSVLLHKYIFVLDGVKSMNYPWIATGWESLFSFKDILTSILIIGQAKILPPLWSLIIEVQASVILPFLILGFKALNKENTILIFSIISALMIGSKITWLIYMPEFLLGLILAKYKVEFVSYYKRLSPIIKAIIFIVAMGLYLPRFTYLMGSNNEILIRKIVSVGSALLIIIALSDGIFSSFLRKKVVKFFGKISYTIYIIHWPLLLTLSSYLFPRTGSYLLIGIIYIPLTIISAYLLTRYIEIPLHNFGKNLVNKITLGKDKQEMHEGLSKVI